MRIRYDYDTKPSSKYIMYTMYRECIDGGFETDG